MNDEYHGHITLEDGSHVLLTAEMAKVLWEAAERSSADRAALMPTSRDAMRMISKAHQRMNDLGWWKGGDLRVKRGDECAVREDTSTGIWSGWIDADGEYVHYCDSVSAPRKVWLKPLADLTDDEREQMAECDASEWAWRDRMIQSFVETDQYDTEEPLE